MEGFVCFSGKVFRSYEQLSYKSGREWVASELRKGLETRGMGKNERPDGQTAQAHLASVGGQEAWQRVRK